MIGISKREISDAHRTPRKHCGYGWTSPSNKHNRRNLLENRYQCDRWDIVYFALTIDPRILCERDACKASDAHHRCNRIHTNISYISLRRTPFVSRTCTTRFAHWYVLDWHRYFRRCSSHSVVLPYVGVLRRHAQHGHCSRTDDDGDGDDDDYEEAADYGMDETRAESRAIDCWMERYWSLDAYWGCCRLMLDCRYSSTMQLAE